MPPVSPPLTVKTRPVRARPNAVPIPRLMLRMPEAIPAWSLGTDPMMAALFGEVNSPSPMPIRANSPTIPTVARSDQAEQEEPARHECHPTGGGHAGPEVIGHPAGQGGHQTEHQGKRHQLETGPGDAVAQATLGIEGDEQEHAEHHQV